MSTTVIVCVKLINMTLIGINMTEKLRKCIIWTLGTLVVSYLVFGSIIIALVMGFMCILIRMIRNDRECHFDPDVGLWYYIEKDTGKKKNWHTHETLKK